MQSYRLRLHDLVHALEVELKTQEWTNEYQLPYHSNHRFREHLYHVLQGNRDIDEFHRIVGLDPKQIQRFIELSIPEDKDVDFPLTLADQLLNRLKWDGKSIDQSIRDSLLRVGCRASSSCFNCRERSSCCFSFSWNRMELFPETHSMIFTIESIEPPICRSFP